MLLYVIIFVHDGISVRLQKREPISCHNNVLGLEECHIGMNR
jgi:hypothetical protein